MVALEQPVFLAATGNRFALVDAVESAPPADPGALARRLCAEPARPLDGLLVVTRAPGADVRMLVFNADGSRAEACGNGLRCVAKLARERGHAQGDGVLVATDAGARRVRLRREGGRVTWAEASLGEPRVVALDERIEADGRAHACALVELGNPHCVLFVERLDDGLFERLGPALARHPRFPAGTNVELVAPAPGGLAMRVWERGVGETASCGSGAAAVATAALLTGRARSPLALATRGGPLAVRWDGAGSEVFVGGGVEELA